MIIHPNFDPVALSLGPLQLRWYGFMYLLAFAAAWLLARRRVYLGQRYADETGRDWTKQQADDLIAWCCLGAVTGGRIGYVVFYNLSLFLADPLEIFRVWHGGMSFHGGLLGVLAAFGLYFRKTGKTFLQTSDFTAPLVHIGLFFGRIGNFINGELWGTPSNAPWAVLFPHAGSLPRHPSQLYEAVLEGLVLFAVLWTLSAKKRPAGLISGCFALLYCLFRFLVEFVREPDVHLGYLAFGWLTMGQILCLPLILVGLLLIAHARRA